MTFHCSINADEIKDDPSLHDVFAKALGFPSFYGRNWDAWIDCMTSIDDADSGLSKITVPKGELFKLHIIGIEGLRERCPAVHDALIECAAFVNHRRVKIGESPVLALVLE
jgi:hypothetical protein